MNNPELINFIDLTFEQKKMILDWRNHPKIRKWMYNQNEISLEEHLSFIENLKIYKEKLYFLVKNDEKYIGVIDFVDITSESLHMGIYTNPNLYGQGSVLLNEIIKYSFENLKVNEIFSEVFELNTKALELYKKFGFEEILKKEINENNIIKLILRNV